MVMYRILQLFYGIVHESVLLGFPGIVSCDCAIRKFKMTSDAKESAWALDNAYYQIAPLVVNAGEAIEIDRTNACDWGRFSSSSLSHHVLSGSAILRCEERSSWSSVVWRRRWGPLASTQHQHCLPFELSFLQICTRSLLRLGFFDVNYKQLDACNVTKSRIGRSSSTAGQKQSRTISLLVLQEILSHRCDISVPALNNKKRHDFVQRCFLTPSHIKIWHDFRQFASEILRIIGPMGLMSCLLRLWAESCILTRCLIQALWGEDALLYVSSSVLLPSVFGTWLDFPWSRIGHWW